MVYIENMCLVIHIVTFFSYKLTNIGIQGNENSFFTWYLKVVLNWFSWNLEFVPNESKTHYSLQHRFLPVSFMKILRTHFLDNTSGDCFWIGLMVRKFNFVPLIFLNSQLYNAPPECSLLFWCNEEHMLMKKM